jgi:hypothetical protein
MFDAKRREITPFQQIYKSVLKYFEVQMIEIWLTLVSPTSSFVNLHHRAHTHTSTLVVPRFPPFAATGTGRSWDDASKERKLAMKLLTITSSGILVVGTYIWEESIGEDNQESNQKN